VYSFFPLYAFLIKLIIAAAPFIINPNNTIIPLIVKIVTADIQSIWDIANAINIIANKPNPPIPAILALSILIPNFLATE
jgi:phospholipase C